MLQILRRAGFLEVANENLRRSGFGDNRIFFVGNTMIDTLLAPSAQFRQAECVAILGLEKHRYFVATLHRPANVDYIEDFRKLLQATGVGTRGLPVIFPVLPRTRKTLDELDERPGNLHPIDPQPYLEFNGLVQDAMGVITDSGGISDEAKVIEVPRLTLRVTKERPEFVTVGTNELIGTDPAAFRPALDRPFEGTWNKGGLPEDWDWKAAERIVQSLERVLGR